jgi:hypothetical protein
MNRILTILFFFMLALTACKETKIPVKPKVPSKKPIKKTPESIKVPPKVVNPDPSDPFDPNDQKVLFEIFRANRLKGTPRLNVLAKYRLVNELGSVNEGRTKVYQKAIQDFAAKNPDQWGEFVDSLTLRPK